MIGTTAVGNGAPEGAHDTPDHKKPRPQQAWGAGSAYIDRGSNPLSGFCQTPGDITGNDSTGKGEPMVQAIVTAAILLMSVFLAGLYLWRSRKTKPRRHPMSGFKFKNAQAFFDYHCQYGDTNLHKGAICYAMVSSDVTDVAASNFGPAEPNYQILSLTVANKDGGFRRIVPHNADSGRLEPGDLVAWVPSHKHETMGWQGPIVAKCAPEFVDTGVRVLALY